jgi:hypothetical protein
VRRNAGNALPTFFTIFLNILFSPPSLGESAVRACCVFVRPLTTAALNATVCLCEALRGLCDHTTAWSHTQLYTRFAAMNTEDRLAFLTGLNASPGSVSTPGTADKYLRSDEMNDVCAAHCDESRQRCGGKP